MAAVLPSNPDTPQPGLTPDSPSSLPLPNVFVIPPEEEQAHSPPYCCFDAAAPIEEDSYVFTDMDCLDVAMNLVHQSPDSPTFHRPYESDWDHDMVMPRRADGQSHTAQQWENAVREARRYYEAGEDSEIIEVIKVRKNEGMGDIFDGRLEEEVLRKSQGMTLKSRASQAFRSIKNIGKSSRKVHAKDVFAGSEEYRGSLESNATTIRSENHPERGNAPRSQTPEARPRKLLRRKSRPLSSMFTLAQGARSATNVATAPAAHEPASLVISDSESQPSPNSSTAGSSGASGSGTSSSVDELGSSPRLVAPEEPARSVSPTLSIKRSFSRRLSMLNLNRIFTPSSVPSDEPSAARPVPAPYPIPTPISPDSRSIQFSPCPTESSSEALATPTDEFRSPSLPSLPASSSLDLSSLGIVTPENSASSIPTSNSTTSTMTHPSAKGSPNSETAAEVGELHLDSLHFDSLHFDAEEFDISLS
ncbi:hypothetical protein GLOTRDRAFT_126973 [Gloeophyllum trabeum ATCC 11539]|uniref:Uncharacterized protein n=1 Tax=Gloeophyllum trabeum (strain ATCC 11539 / FP-39264 / Madison 617) TaxID=670483 RepID=S7QF59_GLOTA|nr:uncharacterized protein GLOTRDRAFT_126973 [Gloeophyllum trabeum ATCC 11539]EPQ58476.1 hypothetical protein GLOTRDRAFT_126973 [Gloeophyllum trabeum ATCC 11539]